MTKSCPGYTSDGSAGQAYSQTRHDVEFDSAHFSPGKSQCRDCYTAYARDWRAKRNAGRPSTPRRTSSAAPRPIIQLPDFRAPAMDGGGEDAEFVSEEDLQSRSHAFVPIPELIETWGFVTNAAAGGSHPYNLMFLGPSGCGKTEAAQYLAALVGLPFTKVDAPAMTDPESWFGTREVIAEDGVSITSYRPSAFVLAIEQPGVLLIDEMNRSRDEHRNVLLSLMDGTHQCTNPLTGDVVRKHPRCFIIMTGNRGLQFTGTYAIDPAFLTRSLTVQFDYAPQLAEVQIAQEATGCDQATAELFVRFAVEARNKARINEDYAPISTREIIFMSRAVMNGATPDLAARVVVINAASDEGGAASVKMGLEQIWAGIRVSAGKPNVSTTPCGSTHPYLTDTTTGDPITCAVDVPVGAVDPKHPANPQHKSVGGQAWFDQP